MVAKCHRYQKPRGFRRMNRRGFLGAILAAASAPAIVRADSLMRIVSHETLVLTVEAPYLSAEASMVRTLFGALTAEQKRVWAEALRREVARPPSNFSRFFVVPA